MDRRLIEQKVESLRRCLARVQAKCPAMPEELAADADLQDIISLNLTRAVQLAVDIANHLIAETELPPPNTMGESFDRLAAAGTIKPELAQRLRRAVGFRNLAVHNYQTIDWAIVHALATTRLGDFADFVRAALAAFPAGTNPSA